MMEFVVRNKKILIWKYVGKISRFGNTELLRQPMKLLVLGKTKLLG